MSDDPTVSGQARGMPAAVDSTARPRPLAAAALALGGIAALAFVVRIAWIAYSGFTPTLSDDAGRYDLLGRSLAHAAGYVNINGKGTLFWPPGYPFILAAVYRIFDDSVRAALVLNALLAAGTVLLVYAIACRAFDARPALLAALLYALMPSAVFFAGVTLSETLFTFLLLLGLWLIVEASARRSWPLLCAAGVAIGYAALTRGQAALIPLVAVPFWLWRQQTDTSAEAAASDRWRGTIAPALLRAALVGLIAVAVVAPWTVRNYIESGAFVPISTNAGVDFYIGHSAGADGRGRIVNELVFRYPDLPGPESEAKVSSDGYREGLSYAAHHPLREVSLSARKLFWLYYSDHEALRWIDGHGERYVLSRGVFNALSRLSDVYYWLLLVLATLGVRRWLAFPRDLAGATRLLLVSLAVYWTLVHIAFFADPRFHAPIMPVLSMWAAVAIIEVAGPSLRRLRPTPARPTA